MLFYLPIAHEKEAAFFSHVTMDLKTKMIAILIAPKFQDDEAIFPAKFLRDHGADVRYIGLQRGTCHGKNTAVIPVDSLVSEVHPNEFDGLVIPGGGAPEFLRQSKEVLVFVKAFMDAGKPVAAICHGPQVLMSAKATAHRKMTCYPGIQDDLTNSGALYQDQEVVVDNNLITSRTPEDLPAFNQAFAKLLSQFDKDSPWVNATPSQAMEFAIANEIKSQKVYEALGKRTKDRLAKAKFKYLSEVERGHRVTLEGIFEKLYPGRKPEPRPFEQSGEAPEDIDPDGDIMKTLRVAIAAEEAANRLYQQFAAKVLNPKTKKVFQRLAEDELEHKSLLEMEYTLRTGSGMPSAVEKEPWWSQDLW